MKKIIAIALFVILLIQVAILFGSGWWKAVFLIAKDWAPTFNEICLTLTIIIGGVWTYLRFIRGRLCFPQAKLIHEISEVTIEESKILVRVTLIVKNIGNTLIPVPTCDTKIQQIKPLPSELSGKLANNAIYIDNYAEIKWPTIDMRTVVIKSEIEPNETDEYVFDFVIDNNIETILIYSYVPNIKKMNFGWPCSTIYTLREN